MANVDQIITNYLRNNLTYPIVQDEAADDTPTPYVLFATQMARADHHFKSQGCQQFTNYNYTIYIDVVTSDTDTADPTIIFNEVRDLMHGKEYPATGPGINKTMVANTSKPPKNTTYNTRHDQMSCKVFINETITI